MKENFRQSIRHANISIGVGALIVVVGVLVFRGFGEAALQLVAISTFVGSLGTYVGLKERARRQRSKNPQ